MHRLRIHYFQHVSFEDLGFIEQWAKAQGHVLSATKFYESFTLPDLAETDWLIVMGGPMNVYQEAEYPWLQAEKALIWQAITQRKTVLGFCLGAQLIADVLGASVYPHVHKEIGWFPVKITETASRQSLLSGWPAETVVFHWHGDTFDLPEDAVHLFTSEGCRNQGFMYQNHLIGLQFHPEVMPHSVQNMVTHGSTELQNTSPYVQPAETLLNANHFTTMHQLLKNVLNQLASRMISSGN